MSHLVAVLFAILTLAIALKIVVDTLRIESSRVVTALLGRSAISYGPDRSGRAACA